MSRLGLNYHKFKPVFAREVMRKENIVTFTSVGKETSNTAHPGDYIVKNQTTAAEQYVIPAGKFKLLYRWLRKGSNGFDEYSPKGEIIALKCDQQTLERLGLRCPFEFEASWGDKLIVYPGDYLVCPPDFSEVYKISPTEFRQTYRLRS
mgnify:CR=1 FL=1